MNSVVCFGEALIDFHARASSPGEARRFIAHPGGAPANVSVAVARLGGNAAFVGMLGTDLFGDILLHDLGAAGVETQYVRRTNAANTALAFVTLDEDGERSFSFYRPPAADLLFRASDFDTTVFAGAAIFHAGSCSLTDADIAETTLAGMRRARAAGALVSFDMNLRPALWPRGEDPSPRLWKALELADLVKLSANEFAFLGASLDDGGAVQKRLWQGATKLLVVTDGARPTRWFMRTGAGSQPAFHVSAVDSTGAGDAFTAGLLQGLAEQRIGVDAFNAFVADDRHRDAWLRFAAACGALAVARTGSFAAMPRRETVEHFLVSRS